MNIHFGLSMLLLEQPKFSYTSIYPVNSKPHGHSYGEWCSRWWQWLLSIPKQSNPAFDTSGINANINQKFPDVFFLCQTYEGVKSIPNRNVRIPKNKSIFMPIINWISILYQDGETEIELLDKATQRMNKIGDMTFSINDVTVKNKLHDYRVLSPFFEIELPEDNIVGLPAGKRLAVSDGYWIFLRPLQGEIHLHSFGSCSSGATKIEAKYEITLTS